MSSSATLIEDAGRDLDEIGASDINVYSLKDLKNKNKVLKELKKSGKDVVIFANYRMIARKKRLAEVLSCCNKGKEDFLF